MAKLDTPSEAVRSGKGRLILVVGASRAGKDTALRGAQASGDPSLFIATRDITRDPDPEREEFRSVSHVGFALRWLLGHYALSWDRYRSWYGVPKEIETHLTEGRCVIVNVSKDVLAKARRRYPGLKVVWVQTDLDILKRRMETTLSDPAELAERLENARKYKVTGSDVAPVWNNGTKEECVAAFLAELRA